MTPNEKTTALNKDHESVEDMKNSNDALLLKASDDKNVFHCAG